MWNQSDNNPFVTFHAPPCKLFLIFVGLIFILNHPLCHFRLSNLILKDSEAALRASVLFCLNPASIFYSSMYKSWIFFYPFEYKFTCSPYAYRRGIFRSSGLHPRKLGNVLDPRPINNFPSYPTFNVKIKKGAVYVFFEGNSMETFKKILIHTYVLLQIE